MIPVAALLAPLILYAQPPGVPASPWSAGVFAAYDSQPYRGAGEEWRAYPFISYRGERFQWYGPSVRYALFQGEAWTLSVHAGVQFPPYEEDDSDALEGMGDRSTTVVGGLNLETRLRGPWELRLSLDGELFGAYDGLQASAALARSIGSPRAPLSGSLAAGVLAQDEKWTAYHVGVPEGKARTDRPAHHPDAGLHPFAAGRVLWRVRGDWTAMLMVRMEFLDDSWRDSPLVADDTRTTGLLTVGYSF